MIQPCFAPTTVKLSQALFALVLSSLTSPAYALPPPPDTELLVPITETTLPSNGHLYSILNEDVDRTVTQCDLGAPADVPCVGERLEFQRSLACNLHYPCLDELSFEAAPSERIHLQYQRRAGGFKSRFFTFSENADEEAPAAPTISNATVEVYDNGVRVDTIVDFRLTHEEELDPLLVLHLSLGEEGAQQHLVTPMSRIRRDSGDINVIMPQTGGPFCLLASIQDHAENESEVVEVFCGDDANPTSGFSCAQSSTTTPLSMLLLILLIGTSIVVRRQRFGHVLKETYVG